MAGGGLGLILATYGVRLMRGIVPDMFPMLQHMSVDLPVLAFTFGISIVTGLLFGLVPAWRSSHTKVLYFTSERDGFRCIWSQRLEPATKRPLGAAIAIYHAHQAQRSLMNVSPLVLEIAVARDKIVFNMGERTGNIWMIQLGR